LTEKWQRLVTEMTCRLLVSSSCHCCVQESHGEASGPRWREREETKEDGVSRDCDTIGSKHLWQHVSGTDWREGKHTEETPLWNLWGTERNIVSCCMEECVIVKYC